MGYHSLLQGIFPTQGSNPDLPHCRQILYQLSHQGSPPPSQTPTLLSGFDFPGQGLWPLQSEAQPGWKMPLITKLLHLCCSSIIEDCAKNIGSWDKYHLFRKPSSHPLPTFPPKDIPRKGAWQGGAGPQLSSTKEVRFKLRRTVQSQVRSMAWWWVHTISSYHSRESKRKHLDMYIATWHCQDTQAHDLIFYKLSVCNWLKKKFNSPLPQIIWETLPGREQDINQYNLHTHKMVKIVPTGQNLDFLCSDSPSDYRKMQRIRANNTKVPNPLSKPIPSLVCWKKGVPFYWLIFWQRQENPNKEEWEGDSSEDSASLWTYVGLRVSMLHTLQIKKSAHF